MFGGFGNFGNWFNNIGNKTGGGQGNGLFAQLMNQGGGKNEAPKVESIQLDNVTGEYDPVKSAEVELATDQKTKPLTMSDRIFGRELTKDVQKINPETGEMELTTVRSSRPGFLSDLDAGMRENYYNEFNPNNLRGNSVTSDGRKKGIAYRIGEGLGTFTRGMTGAIGNGFIAGSQGLDAGLKFPQIQAADKLYRQQLKDNYGFTDEDLQATKGYIDANTFNNLTKSQNSAMSIALRQQTTQSMNRLRELQIEKQRIINSTLPEMEKAKLMKANAEAAHAEEMQIAKINYFNNAIANPLGWANYGLKVDQYNDKKAKDAQDAANEQKVIDSLTGTTPPPGRMPGEKTQGWAF